MPRESSFQWGFGLTCGVVTVLVILPIVLGGGCLLILGGMAGMGHAIREDRIETLRAEEQEQDELQRPDPAQLRRWSTADGQFTVEAQFVDLDGGTVTLRNQRGAIIEVPLDRLSPDDQRWIFDHPATP